jgi:hypothetical protein
MVENQSSEKKKCVFEQGVLSHSCSFGQGISAVRNACHTIA